MTRQLPLLLTAVAFLWWGQASNATPAPMPQPCTLEELSRGFPVAIQGRFQVMQVKLAASDVSPLFLLTSSHPSRAYVTVTIKLRSRRLIHQLQTLLSHQAAPHLTLVLEDLGLQSSIYRALPKVLQLGERFEEAIDIPILLNPCERVTAIVYENIDAILKHAIEKGGITREPVTLDQVFDLLVKGKIDPYMAHLQPLDAHNQCFKTFMLLNWLRQGDARGFEFSGYRITDDLKDILDHVAKALQETETWQQHEFSVSVTGFTDAVLYDHDVSPLEAARTGVPSLEDPLHIWYSGCTGDRPDGKAPIEVPFGGTGARKVGVNFKDNCSLGAVRAYVTLAFLKRMLGGAAGYYQYATGGISPQAPVGKKDAKARKTVIQFRVLAATRSQGTRTYAPALVVTRHPPG